MRASQTALLGLLCGSMALVGVFVGCSESSSDDCASLGMCIDDDASVDHSVGDGGGDHAVPGADGSNEAGDDDGGSDGSVDAPVDSADAAHCDPEGDPKTQGCVITEANGVFVSPTGSDATGDGTKAKPFATIGKGAVTAKSGAKHVFVCAGAFTAAETIGVDGDGVKIYGGIDCATGKYSGAKTSVAPAAPAIALTVDSLVAGLVVEDIEFDAADGVTPGASSIAVFVKSSANVTFRRVTMRAGAGVVGTTGTDGNNYVPIAADDARIAGGDAVGPTGGSKQLCTQICADVNPDASGGAGGNGSATPTSGSAGTPDLGAVDANNGAAGFGACDLGGTGHNGASAVAAAGGIGATTLGSLGANGWTPGAAAAGATGGRGQGGGGGSGGFSATKGGGGGGGCGGCGGGGGTGGGAGGSSFALLVFSSGVSTSDSVLHSSLGGLGGHGGTGQLGEAGGKTGATGGLGCFGGTGGTGGAGGGGGGGAGGISASVGYSGTAPTLTNTTTEFAAQSAAGGDPGAGGSPAATAGIKGISQAVVNLQ